MSVFCKFLGYFLGGKQKKKKKKLCQNACVVTSPNKQCLSHIKNYLHKKALNINL